VIKRRLVLTLGFCFVASRAFAAPADHIVVSNSFCLLTPCPTLPPPSNVVGAGTSVGVFVAAFSPSFGIDPSYVGTLHFTSSDPASVLPADYLMTAADQGGKAFTVVFRTPGPQTVSVSSGNLRPGSFQWVVTPAQAAAGIPMLSKWEKLFLALAIGAAGWAVLRGQA
jgi:hypothetical protein